MGYYTGFDLTLSRVDGLYILEEEEVNEICSFASTINGYSIDDLIQYGEVYSCKWYNCLKDMKKISEKFPHILFTLHGNGEKSDDIWTAYFLAGKMQHEKARIVIDEFDPNKLV